MIKKIVSYKLKLAFLFLKGIKPLRRYLKGYMRRIRAI